MKSRAGPWSGLALLGLLAAPGAGAASLYCYVDMSAFENELYDNFAEGTSLAFLQHDAIGLPSGPKDFRGEGSATASYGSLGARASLNMSNYDAAYFNTSRPVDAGAFATDTFTITGRNGAGRLRMRVGLEGALAATQPLELLPQVLFTISYPGGTALLVTGAGENVTDPIPFTFGAPLELTFALRAGLVRDGVAAVEVFAESNFGSTATIRIEDVRDDGGGLVPDFTLQTESGATYEAPEPGRALLLATGIAALAGLRRPWARRIERLAHKRDEGHPRPLLPRSFASLSQAEEENGQSRIYLGIHFSFDKTEGIAQGRRVANYVFRNLFVPARPPHR